MKEIGMPGRPQILCIDDESAVLEGLELSLHGLGEIHTAESGAEGLQIASRLPRLALVICDMRMPLRDGARVLQDFHEAHPDATRILLTGYTDITDAISAVNHGRIFRFLTKPCQREVLHASVRDALRQYELVCAERELLEHTLKGAIDAMTDALATANPAVFGQAQRVRTLCAALAERLNGRSDWVLEIAAMLLHLGLVGLPEDLQKRLLQGEDPDQRQRQLVAQGFSHALENLQRVPRLGPVRDVIRLAEPLAGGNLEWAPEQRDAIRQWSAILRAARSFVRLEANGFPADAAVAKLRPSLDQQLIDALSALVGGGDGGSDIREVGLAALESGMVLAKPLYTESGQLLAPAGYEIREGFARRLAELRPEMRLARFSVMVPRRDATGTSAGVASPD
jgi:CheY-like chemotaxis protein